MNAQEYMQAQNKVKYIYLYNFIKDIEWPNSSDSDINICLFRKDDFYDDLQKFVTSKKVNEKTIQVSEVSSLSECRRCNLVFIDENILKEKLKLNQDCSSLVVTCGFYEQSLSNIALMFHDNKLQFSINKTLCKKNGFKVSTHLSSFANQKMIEQ